MYKTAITGIGIVGCLGNNVDTVAASLREGRCGIGLDEKRLQLGFRSALTGMVRDYDPGSLLSRKQRKTMPDFAVWSYDACLQALHMAGLEADAMHSPESGVIFGCDSSALAAVEQTDALREHKDTARLGSGLIFRSMNSTVTMNLNILLGNQGACWTVSSACSSGGHAIGQAADLIALGRQERVLCGGAQEINWQSICSFDGLGAFSRRMDTPHLASRPFDAKRDGLVPSGGAAALLLERMDIAKARGALILGEVLGYAFSSDGKHISVPSGDGLARAMRQALERGGMPPSEVDSVNAHATSTQAGDAAEAQAIREVFADTAPDVLCLKALTGHELWMSGASQAVYGAILARDGFLPPYPGFEAADEACQGLRITTGLQPRPPRVMLCNAAGFGGTNSCLLLRFSP